MTKKISAPFCGYLFYTSLNMKNLIFHFVPSISLLLSSLAISEGSYSVLVPSAREVCIAIKAPENKSSQISGSFELISTEPPNPLRYVITKISRPNVPEYESIGESVGRFQITGEGTYSVCIENGIKSGINDGLYRKVGFNIRVKEAYESLEEESGPMTDHVYKIEELTDHMLYNLEDLLEHLEMMKERERLHRNLTESTFQNVWRWHLFEKVILLLIAIGQISYYKTFFRVKRGYY